MAVKANIQTEQNRFADSSVEAKAQQHSSTFPRSSLPALSERASYVVCKTLCDVAFASPLQVDREIHFSPNVAEFCGNCYFGYLF
jgi:hypothetical protein